MLVSGRTDTGRVRTNNEDAFAIDTQLQTLVLADGMGGLNAGEHASSESVRALLHSLRGELRVSEESFRHAFDVANRRVFTLSCERPELANMGTTLVVWTFLPGESLQDNDPNRGEQCLIGNIGDSRAYRFRGGKLEQLTRDHSVVQQLVDEGLLDEEEARTAPNRNIITRAIGIEIEAKCVVTQHDVEAYDLYILCSDGLSDMLSDAEISAIVENNVEKNIDRNAETKQRSLDDLADALIAAANNAGGFDNITVVVHQCTP